MTNETALSCLQTWGSNRPTETTVQLPGLRVYVFCSPIGTSGGDLHYLSVCNEGVVSRIALADISGHGEDLQPYAVALHRLMAEHINEWDQSALMRNLNEALHLEQSGERYASAVLLGYYREARTLAYTNAGHPKPLRFLRHSGAWQWIEESRDAGMIAGLPVGLIPGTDYSQTGVELGPGDLLVLYSDGITESEDSDGEELGPSGLIEWVSDTTEHTCESVGRALVQRLSERTFGDPSDDRTILVIECE